MELLDLIIRNKIAIAGFGVALLALLSLAWGVRNESVSGKTYVLLFPVVAMTLLAGVIFKRSWLVAMLVVIGAVCAIWFLVPDTVALEPPLVLRCKPEDTKLLVFIHGWNGDSRATWRKFPALVLQDDRFVDVDVVSFGYPTFMRRRNLRISALAKWFYDDLSGIVRLEHYRKIALVSHSMGGLVAREVCILNSLSQVGRNFGLSVEIATPHLGAELGEIINALGISRGVAEDVNPGSSFLSGLRVHWEGCKDRPRTSGITSPADSVVTEDSALFQCDATHEFPSWGHIELVKPESADDPRYRVVMKDVEDYLAGS